MNTARFLSAAAVVAVTLALGGLIYILLCARVRRLFASVRAVRWLNRVSAAILVVAGLLIASATGHGSAQA